MLGAIWRSANSNEKHEMTEDIFIEKCNYASNLMDNPQSNWEHEDFWLLCGLIVDVFRYSEFGENNRLYEYQRFLDYFRNFIRNKKQRGKLKDIYFSRHYDKDSMNNRLTDFLNIGYNEQI